MSVICFPVPVRATLLCAFVALAAKSAIAQGNEVHLLQDSPLSATEGNSLYIDQSLAMNGRLLGMDGPGSPAIQTGSGNDAWLKTIGHDIAVYLEQGSREAPGLDNSVALLATGRLIESHLLQDGNDNSGIVKIIGQNATGDLTQQGDGNFGLLTVAGSNVSGRLLQVGDDNATALTVTGRSSDVTYEVLGSGMHSALHNPSVYSNAPTVIVRQMAYGND